MLQLQGSFIFARGANVTEAEMINSLIWLIHVVSILNFLALSLLCGLFIPQDPRLLIY